jgi:hypothetical protein
MLILNYVLPGVMPIPQLCNLAEAQYSHTQRCMAPVGVNKRLSMQCKTKLNKKEDPSKRMDTAMKAVVASYFYVLSDDIR